MHQLLSGNLMLKVRRQSDVSQAYRKVGLSHSARVLPDPG